MTATAAGRRWRASRMATAVTARPSPPRGGWRRRAWTGPCASHDGPIRWYRMTDGSEILTLFPLADRRNWVAWTPEGFYRDMTTLQRPAGNDGSTSVNSQRVQVSIC